MYYEEESSSVLSFISGMLVGAAIAAAVSLLLAPQSGRRTRRRLVRSMEGFRDTATHRLDDVADDMKDAVRSGRKKLSF